MINLFKKIQALHQMFTNYIEYQHYNTFSLTNYIYNVNGLINYILKLHF